MSSGEADWLTLWRELAVNIIEQREMEKTMAATLGEVRHSYEATARLKTQERADPLLHFVLQQPYKFQVSEISQIIMRIHLQ